MTSRICARLILTAGIAGLAQVEAGAQATLDATQSQFGTQPAPYAQPAQPSQTERGIPVAQPIGSPGMYAPAQDSGSLGAPDPSKPLGRGDIVTFSIAQDREPPQTMRVTDTGELDFSIFPKIGRISVVGRTCAQVAAELKHKLEADYYNAADVTLGINQVNLSSIGKVYITGNVRAPGPEDLPSNQRTTLSNAIIRAGGFAQYANDRKVQVTRRDKVTGQTKRFTVDVRSIIVKGRMDLDVELQDGDYINVPQKVVNF